MDLQNITVRKPNLAQWIKIYRLYQVSFPAGEKKPFWMIVKKYLAGTTDVWYFEREGKFAALAITINGSDTVLIDYLAVNTAVRGSGIGSAALKMLREKYSGMRLFLEIESAFDDCDNKAERISRRNFYIKNGMSSMGVMAYLFGEKMELMGFDCKLSFKDYKEFYALNHSPWAANHISEAEYPKDIKGEV